METGTQLGNPRKPPREGQEGVQRRRAYKKAAPLIVGTTIWKEGGQCYKSARYIGVPRESADGSIGLLIGRQGRKERVRF